MTSPETPGPEQSISWQLLEARIARLERHLGLAPLDSASQTSVAEADSVSAQNQPYQQGPEFEASVGEFGLAWIGSFVFFLGVVFLINYASNLGYRVLSTALG